MPRQIVTHYPNHVWSVDRTRVWRWHIWPTWVLVAIDHFSRKVVASCVLQGPNAGWVVEALENAFVRQGAPKHIITDQEGVFVGDVFAELLTRWNVKQRFGAVGKHGSIAVTERGIRTLKHEWLKRVPVIKGLDHLEALRADFTCYYNGWRPHMASGGAVPEVIHAGQHWQRPARTAILPRYSRYCLPSREGRLAESTGWPPSLTRLRRRHVRAWPLSLFVQVTRPGSGFTPRKVSTDTGPHALAEEDAERYQRNLTTSGRAVFLESTAVSEANNRGRWYGSIRTRRLWVYDPLTGTRALTLQ